VNASPNGQLSGTIIMEGGNGVNSAGLASIRHSWTPHARTTLRPWSRTIAKVLPPMPRKVRNIQDIGMERNYFARGIFFFTSAYVYSFTFAFVLCKIPAILFSLSLSLSFASWLTRWHRFGRGHARQKWRVKRAFHVKKHVSIFYQVERTSNKIVRGCNVVRGLTRIYVLIIIAYEKSRFVSFEFFSVIIMPQKRAHSLFLPIYKAKMYQSRLWLACIPNKTSYP